MLTEQIYKVLKVVILKADIYHNVLLLLFQTAAEYERRRENFFNELEVVFADVVIILLSHLFLWSVLVRSQEFTMRNCENSCYMVGMDVRKL